MNEKTVIRAYKGFEEDMTCRDFQYKEGREYETAEAKECECGFHACEYPLDCFPHYSPSDSVYHEVELSGEISKSYINSKIAATKIKIGPRLSIAELVQAAIDFTTARVNPEAYTDEDFGMSSVTDNYRATSVMGNYGASFATGDSSASATTGNESASSATGPRGVSLATGYKSATLSTGYKGASLATGNYGASSATGNNGTSSATGYEGISSATGDFGVSAATSYKGASSVTGSCGVSSVTGYKCSSEANDPSSIAVAWGYQSKAKGVIGSHLVLSDWEGNEDKYWIASEWELKGIKMVQIDGEKYKPDKWYTMKDGEVVEAE